MFPDFTKAKARVNRLLLRWVQEQVPVVTPLMRGVQTFHQHEGRAGMIVRVDASEGQIDYKEEEFEFTLTHDEMRRFGLELIQQKLLELAKQLGEAQSKTMLEMAGKAAHKVGNVVHAEGKPLTPEKFLEVFKKVQMEFDPKSLQPKPGHVFVMHPDMAAKIVPKVREWEKDPKFNAEYEQIIDENREAWRAREASRKLVS